ncbi:MAG: lipoprotein [Pseudomonadota bacterium]
MSTYRFAPVTLFLMAIAACGQKGPLYLPDDAPATSVPAATTEQTPTEEESADEDQRQ